ncbi:MAG: ABC transporter ATP-binding protein [Candidatus Caldarchaeum sp.]
MIKTFHLCVGYDGKPVLSDIAVHIPKGQLSLVIGPNASGKTTFLKTLAGLLKPVAGTVFVGADELHRLSNRMKARRIGVLLTGKPDVVGMAVEEVVALGRYPWTGPVHLLTARDYQIISTVMEKTGISAIRGRRIHEISDGQLQRVMIARALAQEPEILILDEPTTHLDAKSRIEILTFLRKLAHEENMTVLASTHELELAFRFADNLLLVSDGQVVVSDNPEELVNTPAFQHAFGFNGELTLSPTTLSIEFRQNTAAKGPAAFVIAGGGTGAKTYRMLLKQGIQVVSGILHENDIDHHIASMLGVETITEKPFQKISEETFQKAVKKMLSCSMVFYTDPPIAETNRRNLELFKKAVENNIPTFRPNAVPYTAMKKAWLPPTAALSTPE